MKNRHLFNRPGREETGYWGIAGPDREIFCPEHGDWSILTQTAQGGKRK